MHIHGAAKFTQHVKVYYAIMHACIFVAEILYSHSAECSPEFCGFFKLIFNAAFNF